MVGMRALRFARRIFIFSAAGIANRMRLTLPGWLYLWVCDRLYNQASPLYEGIANLISAGRWFGWGRRMGHGLRGIVVEVGPGTGRILAAPPPGARIYGVERASPMAARAARRAPGRLIQGDARALPLRAGVADALIAVFPAIYARDPDFWREAARVVRVGGRVRVLLDAGPGDAPCQMDRLDPPIAAFRVRKGRVAVPDGTLGIILARRIDPGAPPLRLPRRRHPAVKFRTHALQTQLSPGRWPRPLQAERTDPV